MFNKSHLDDIIGRVQSKILKEQPKKVPSVEGGDTDIDHLWMKEDHTQIKKKSVAKKDPRIDTGILRDRIAKKIAKMNNH